MMQILLVSAFLLFTLYQVVHSFIPAELIEAIADKVNHDVLNRSLDEVSETITHDDIIEFGVAQSIADYFKCKPNGTSLIQDGKYDSEYRDIKNIYYDYYGLWICDLGVYTHIKLELRPNVAQVDLDSSTKDNPYYHFDAERLIQSNQLVMNVTKQIYEELSLKDYRKARKLTGQILHTIQDFYSHSNWVELGNKDINTKIGTDEFNTLLVVDTSESDPCISNCTNVKIECNGLLTLLNTVFNRLFGKSITTCPITYYKCYGNIKTQKLVTGYYSGQKLSNGESVVKPVGLNKCSHGGLLDSTVNTSAIGGINKDSGYFVLSPHAYLHLTAAELGIQHTRYFFNQIRNVIGDEEFSKFLALELTPLQFSNKRLQFIHKCSASKVFSTVNIFIICLFSVFFVYFDQVFI